MDWNPPSLSTRSLIQDGKLCKLNGEEEEEKGNKEEEEGLFKIRHHFIPPLLHLLKLTSIFFLDSHFHECWEIFAHRLMWEGWFSRNFKFLHHPPTLSHKHSCTKTDAIGLVCPFAVQHNIMPAFQGHFLARGHRNFYFFLLLPPSPLSFLTYA